MAHPSILNDVIGPIMRGPSSSHTAGAYRIARIARDLAGFAPQRVRVTFDPNGSYAPTCIALGVDMAFSAALLDWEMTDERYAQALGAVAAAGIDLQFDEEPLAHDDHPNTVRIRLAAADATAAEGAFGHEFWARSTGGGIIEFTRVNGQPVGFDGRAWTTVIGCPPAARAEIAHLLATAATATAATATAATATAADDASAAFVVETSTRPDDRLIAQIRARPDVTFALVAAPVLLAQPGPALFTSAAELLALTQSAGGGSNIGAAAAGACPGNIAACAVAYESALLGLSTEACRSEMARRLDVMLASVEAGLDDRLVRMPLVEPSAAAILAAERAGRLPLGGVATRVGARAMAAMHTCNSKGVVCAAPTGGSAGVFAGVLATLAGEMNLPREKLIDACFVAGAVGVVMARRATFAAEEAGCQVEIGFAGAMAGAAIVEVFGGSAAQALAAAAISLQNTSGIVCDTVGGGCEIPCQTRNAAAAAGAFLTADLVMGGYANPIPLDECIDASYAAGRAIPADLRCTARGGLAVSPSARRLVAERTGRL